MCGVSKRSPWRGLRCSSRCSSQHAGEARELPSQGATKAASAPYIQPDCRLNHHERAKHDCMRSTRLAPSAASRIKPAFHPAQTTNLVWLSITNQTCSQGPINMVDHKSSGRAGPVSSSIVVHSAPKACIPSHLQNPQQFASCGHRPFATAPSSRQPCD
jgi:hypothetical protein